MSESHQIESPAAPHRRRWSFTRVSINAQPGQQRPRLLRFALSLLVVAVALDLAAADSPGTNKTAGEPLRIPFPETTVHRVEEHPQNKNILLIARDRVAQDEGSVSGAGKWCGPRLLMFAYGYTGGYGKVFPFHGGFLFDVVSRKMWKLGKLHGGEGIGCSPDGEWLTYFKKVNQGKDLVLWRYHIKTGKKEPFLQLDAKVGYMGMFSPDGKRILYFRKRMGEPIKTGDPQWKISWLGWEQGRQATAVWLADSTGILVKDLSDPKDNLSKSVMWTARPEALDQRRPLRVDSELSQLKVDAANRIYGIHYQTFPHIPGTQQKSKLSLFRCEITTSDSLKCVEAISGNPGISPGYHVSPNGEVIFYLDPRETQGARCIWRYDIKSQKKQSLWCGSTEFTALSGDGGYLSFDGGGLFKADPHGQTRGLAVLRLDDK